MTNQMAHHLLAFILLTQMIPGETSEVTAWVSGTDSGSWYNARAHRSEMWNLAFQTVPVGFCENHRSFWEQTI